MAGYKKDMVNKGNEYCPFPMNPEYKSAGEPIGAPDQRYDDTVARVKDRQNRAKSKMKEQMQDDLY